MVNIFLLDNDVKKAAEYHIDIHIAKGILELAWVFYTVRYNLKMQTDAFYLKRRWINNGCVLWTQASYANYNFLFRLASALNNEMRFRNSKKGIPYNDHKCYEHMHKTYNEENILKVKSFFNEFEITKAYLAMPSIYHTENDVLSYRAYYFFYKRYRMPSISWKNRNIPYWYNMNYFKENKFLPKNYYNFDY